MSMVAYACVVYGFMWFYFARVNKKRECGGEDHKMQGLSDAEVAELGDDSPRFVYTI